MAKSGFLKDTVVPGLKSAFSQAGGMKGLGKRVLGGAAIGGAATGTFSALRGGDFWEGAKSGALAGGIGGAARHGYQMGQTRAASSLSTSIQNERTRMKPTTSRTGDMSHVPYRPKQNQGGNRMTSIASKSISGSDVGVARQNASSASLSRGPVAETKPRVQTGPARSTTRSAGPTTSMANQRKRQAARIPYSSPQAAKINSKQSPNVSRQVHTQTRLGGTNQAARSMFRGR